MKKNQFANRILKHLHSIFLNLILNLIKNYRFFYFKIDFTYIMQKLHIAMFIIKKNN